MKNTLLRETRSPNQKIANVLYVRLFLFILLISPSYENLKCQNDLDEQTRSLIFMSIEIDRSSTYGKIKWERLIELLKNHHDYLQVENSKIFKFVLPNTQDTIRDSYFLQIYKINSENSRDKSRYLLKYVDFNGEVWLRVAGYIENDMKLFFGYLRANGVKKKYLKKLIDEWENSDRIFREVDFPCLLNGYHKNQTSGNCFIAVSYVDLLDLSMGFDPLDEHNINAIFSRIPLYGHFEIRK